MSRPLVLVSGYYGFDNLGDEAILEEICNELKELTDAHNIVVLSANPEVTASRYQVRSIKRTDYVALLKALVQCKLFVSGGGGLFQNTRSLGSILFYGMQIMAARLAGSQVMIYAQGIGPLVGKQAAELTRGFFRLANSVTVRDDASMALLSQWGVPAVRSADPVWMLKETPAPPEVIAALPPGNDTVALSLRPANNFTDTHVRTLAELLINHLPAETHLLLLPLQAEQDIIPLQLFDHFWRQSGRSSTILDTTRLQRPSQWLSVLRQCRGLVGMRLHAIILALKAGIPVAGIAYDPKVSHVLEEFEQPCLILTKDCPQNDWEEALKRFIYGADTLVESTQRHREVAEKLSCQNFELLARMPNMQRGF